jgi:hypothetical protein
MGRTAESTSMPSSRSRRALLAAVVVASVLAVAAPTAAAPPPRPLCDACGDSFAETAAEHGLELAVDRSTATVVVHGNGSATWTVRNHLAGDAAGQLRANATLLAAVGDAAMWDATFLGATVGDDGVVTLRYREAGFAERSVGGTLRSGAFTEAYGYRNLDGLGADRLTVVAPEGMRVARTVPGATVSDDGSETTLTALERGAVVTFAPEGDRLGWLWSPLSVAALLGPALALNALLGIVLPSAVFGLLVAALGGALSWVGTRHRRALARVRAGGARGLLLGGAALAALALLSAAGVGLLGTAATPALGVGVAVAGVGAALSRRRVRTTLSGWRVLAGAALAAVVAAGVTVGAGAVFHRGGPRRATLAAVPFVVALFALLPAGYALGRGRRRLAAATAVAGFALALLPTVPLLTPGVTGAVVGVLLAVVDGTAVLVVGAPLLLVGAALGDAAGDRPPGEGPGGRPPHADGDRRPDDAPGDRRPGD